MSTQNSNQNADSKLALIADIGNPTHETLTTESSVNYGSLQGFLKSSFPTGASLVAPSLAYHEMDAVPVKEVDLIEQLNRNILSLEDLQSRMSFMMREVRYQMKL